MAWLNLVSDFIHNIIDGLAIGVAFAKHDDDKLKAFTTVLAVALHEIP